MHRSSAGGGWAAALLAVGLLGASPARAASTELLELLKERRLERQTAAEADGAQPLLTSPSIGASSLPRVIMPPGAYDLFIDGDLDLGGAIFKDGYKFLHNEGGALRGNTALGIDALRDVTPGAPDNYSGISNTALGKNALRSNTTGSHNTAAGLGALASNLDGRSNVAIGAISLEGNTTGSYNVAVGALALYSNTTGSYNTATGFQTMLYNTGGSYNTATGAYALRNNITGLGNTAAGLRALALNTTGGSNVAVGVRALASNTTGSSNTAIGYRALYANVIGSRNIAVGNGAGSATTGDDNILIDNAGAAVESGVIRLGDAASHFQAYVAGVYNVAITEVHPVYVSDLGQLGMNTSSRRAKVQVEPMGEASSALLELSPVEFSAPDDRRSYGLIAEEVADELPDLAQLDEDGRPATVLYHQLAPMLLNELQKTRARTEERAVLLARIARELELQEDELEDVLARLALEVDDGLTVTPALVADPGGRSSLRSETLGAGPTPRDVTPPGSYAVSLSDDLALGGYVFREGYSVLHNDGGALYGNTAAGFLALQSTTPGAPGAGYGYGNTAFGYRALMSNTSGYLNTAIGTRALEMNESGLFNTALGYDALGGMVSGSRNTAVGMIALDANSVGHLNTVVGYDAAGSASASSGNTFFGYHAAQSFGTGTYNTGLGTGTFQSFAQGSHNTALGHGALDTDSFVSPADGNTGLGADTNTRGSTNNTAIGFESSDQGPTASHSLFVAHYGRVADNMLFLGDEGVQTRSFLAGVVSTPVVGSHAVYVDANGQIGQTTSSRRFKRDIGPLSGADRLGGLRPVVFRAREDVARGGSRDRYGLIAEEVAELLPELVSYDAHGEPQGVLYHLLGPLLLAELQAIDARQSEMDPSVAETGEALGDLRAELVRVAERAGRLGASSRQIVDRVVERARRRERTRRVRASLRARRGLGRQERPLVSPTVGVGIDTPVPSISLANDLELVGYLFKDGAPFLHTDRGRVEESTALGTDALDSQVYPALGNTAVGREALTSATEGYYNTALGNNALLTLTTGYGNSSIGSYSAWSLTDGVYSTAVGDLTMALATTVGGHVAVGASALQYSYAGSEDNAANGMLTLLSNTTGSDNTAVGYAALVSNTVGDLNTAIGFYALGTNSNGTRNTAAGAYALVSNSSGSRNTAVGYLAGVNLTTGNYNVAIGNQGVAGESATLRIGTAGTHTQAFVAGVVGNMIIGVHGLYVDAAGQLGMASSSRRVKTDIRSMGEASRRLLELRPVTFFYKEELARGDSRRRYGLIAEELAEVFPELVSYDPAGRPQGVFYRQLYPMLLNELQRERRLLERQLDQLDAARGWADDLGERLRVLRAEVTRREERELPLRSAAVS